MSVPGLTEEKLAAWREREPSVDAGGMRSRIAGFPGQIDDAVERARGFAAGLPGRSEPPSAIAVLGMGGSAIGADLVRAYTRIARARPLVTIRGYDLPAWLDDRSVVIASSYSGDTEETLAATRLAGERGIPIVAVTTGGRLGERAARDGDPILRLPTGFPPRAALAYSFAACSMIVARLDPGLDLDEEGDALAAVPEFLRRAAEGWLTWDPDNPALGLGARCAARLAVIVGGHPISVAAASRWKAQLNENGKVPACTAELPEHNHNEIVGLEGDHPVLDHTVMVWLETPHDDPRIRARFAFARSFAAERVGDHDRVEARGSTPLESMLWLCHLGDCASFLASVIAGRDPTPVASIDRLKSALTSRREAL